MLRLYLAVLSFIFLSGCTSTLPHHLKNLDAETFEQRYHRLAKPIIQKAIEMSPENAEYLSQTAFRIDEDFNRHHIAGYVRSDSNAVYVHERTLYSDEVTIQWTIAHEICHLIINNSPLKLHTHREENLCDYIGAYMVKDIGQKFKRMPHYSYHGLTLKEIAKDVSRKYRKHRLNLANLPKVNFEAVFFDGKLDECRRYEPLWERMK